MHLIDVLIPLGDDLSRKTKLGMWLVQIGLDLIPRQYSFLMCAHLAKASEDIYAQHDDGRFEGWPPFP